MWSVLCVNYPTTRLQTHVGRLAAVCFYFPATITSLRSLSSHLGRVTDDYFSSDPVSHTVSVWEQLLQEAVWGGLLTHRGTTALCWGTVLRHIPAGEGGQWFGNCLLEMINGGRRYLTQVKVEIDSSNWHIKQNTLFSTTCISFDLFNNTIYLFEE